MAKTRSSLWMQDLSTYLFAYSGFLFDTIVTSESVKSSLFISISWAWFESIPFSARKFCSFLLWLKIVPIISLISYSLFALEVVAMEFTVSTYFCDDRGLLPMDDLGLRGFDVVC